MRSYFLVELLPLRVDWIGSSWVGTWKYKREYKACNRSRRKRG